MAINLRGVFLSTRAALNLMLPGARPPDQQTDSIVNIASVAALRGYYPGFPSLQVSYSTAKARLIGFTRQVAAEYAKEQIRVNAVAPGSWSDSNIRIPSQHAVCECWNRKTTSNLKIPVEHGI